MGEAKRRGTVEQRIARAMELGIPKKKKLNERELRQQAFRIATDYIVAKMGLTNKALAVVSDPRVTVGCHSDGSARTVSQTEYNAMKTLSHKPDEL